VKVSFKLEGDKDVAKELRRLAKAYPDATGAALYQEGFALGALAADKAPVDEGLLRATMYVAPPTQDGRETVVEVGFGTDYAVRQHEALHYRHPKGGEAKYLEKAGFARAAGMLVRLAKRITENVRKGITAKAIPREAPPRPRTPRKRKR
jgi:hypothetical protein